MHATAVTASQSIPAGQLSMPTMALQLLCALPSGSIVVVVVVAAAEYLKNNSH